MKTKATAALEALARFVTKATGLRAVIALRGANPDVTEPHIVGLDSAIRIVGFGSGWTVRGLRRFSR